MTGMKEQPCEDRIHQDDRGFLYGYGLFETFYVDNKGTVFLLNRHMDRLLHSAQALGMVHGHTQETLLSAVCTYIEHTGLCDCIMRMNISAGNPQKDIAMTHSFTHRPSPYTQSQREQGCRLGLTPVRRNESALLVRHKTCNYLENYLLLQKAHAEGFEDVLLLNTADNIAETAKCNVFFVKQGVLYTPQEHCGLLPGIIRGWIVENAPLMGISCRQGNYGIQAVLDADEVFVTNSAMGILYVRELENHCIGTGQKGEVSTMLEKKLISLMKL